MEQHTGGERKILDRVLDGVLSLDEKLAEAAGWVVVLMMLTISYDVAMRYIFNAPTTWSFEVNRYMLIMVIFIGSGWTLASGGHVSVDIATEKLSEKKRILLDVVTSLMAGTYVLVFLVQSIVFTYDAWENNIRSTEYLAWQLWPIRLFLVVGAALLLLEYVVRIIKNTAMLCNAVGAKRYAGLQN
ncbi:TRAP transporter small permease subunit [Desulforhopalus singaporensis]|uniref:TRAP-type mannitol/chloroaromatic compound transport system, small permease component n=1 Tax=Desulforhopalus singaporensis TaxID=91360 RepID=A0A1H0QDG3_9BACT|nr:TRAP transporter small permease [Desulforhopalus singaporensis]SDP15431.1 TRAP-type mannitol/chloroaromatic compound transport system, small permease component [Desulforhopalus singaporensis]